MIMLGKDRHGQVKRWAEYKDQHSDRAFGRLARLTMTGELPGVPSKLELLKPPSYDELADVLLSQDEKLSVENLMLEKLWASEGKKVSRTELLGAAGDKNDRKGITSILDDLLRKYPGGADSGGIVVHQTKRGSTFQYHYSWVSPDSPPSLGDGNDGDKTG